MIAHKHFVSSLALLGVIAAGTAAPAQERGRNPLAGKPAIMHRVELRKLRFEITPQFLISVNQPFLIGVGGGANLQFHINDWLGIGASFHYTGSVASPLEGKIEAGLPKVYPKPQDPLYGLNQPSQQQYRDHLVGPNMLGGVYATLTPMSGKFSLFSALFAHYDFYGLAGVGFANLSTPLSSGMAYQPASVSNSDVNQQDPGPLTGIRAAGVFGIGIHMFLNDFLALQFELRDYLYKSDQGGLDVNTTDGPKGCAQGLCPALTSADEYITSNLYFGVGLSIFLPPRAKIEGKKAETVAYTPTGQKPAEEPAATPASPPVSEKDGDHDGVPDVDDQCPSQPGPKENNGCPVTAKAAPAAAASAGGIQEKKYLVVTEDVIEFKDPLVFTRAELSPSSYGALDELAQVMQERAAIRLRIQGHGEGKGNAKKHMKLAQERAKAVKDYLVRKGVDPSRLAAQGAGDANPIAAEVFIIK